MWIVSFHSKIKLMKSRFIYVNLIIPDIKWSWLFLQRWYDGNYNQYIAVVTSVCYLSAVLFFVNKQHLVAHQHWGCTTAMTASHTPHRRRSFSSMAFLLFYFSQSAVYIQTGRLCVTLPFSKTLFLDLLKGEFNLTSVLIPFPLFLKCHVISVSKLKEVLTQAVHKPALDFIYFNRSIFV